MLSTLTEDRVPCRVVLQLACRALAPLQNDLARREMALTRARMVERCPLRVFCGVPTRTSLYF